MKEKKLSNREFAKIFDSVAEKFDEISNTYTVLRRYNEIIKSVKGNCLEVGAGTGNMISLTKNKKDYLLSDISFKMCKVSKQKYHCNTVCCDAEKLPFSDNTFDTIISSETIYILDHPQYFVKEAFRVLKDKGILIITVANQDMIIYDRVRAVLRSIGLSNMYFDDGVRSFMKLSELKNLLNKNKFRIKIEKKIILFPFKHLHRLNLMIEKTFLSYFSIFNLIVAEKVSK